MPLTSLDRIVSVAKKDYPSISEPELDRCCQAASRMFCSYTGRNAERVTRSVFLDGDDAVGRSGEQLWLPSGDRPLLHAGLDLVTVSENGVSLTVAVGYSTTAGVIVVGANEDRRVRLSRAGSWSCGIQNVAVGYKCGWALDVSGDPQPVPQDVIQVCSSLALLLYREPMWLGKSSESSSGSAVTIISALPELEQAILKSYVVL